MTESVKTISDIVSHLREWADRLPNDPDDGFWFERPCEDMQGILRGLADDIEEAAKAERDARDGAYEEAENMAWILANKMDAIREIKGISAVCRKLCLKAHAQADEVFKKLQKIDDLLDAKDNDKEEKENNV